VFIEASERPILRPAAKASAEAENKVDGFKKEAELGIFQVLDRLEEVTNMLICR
jgi:hypothetical protein